MAQQRICMATLSRTLRSTATLPKPVASTLSKSWRPQRSPRLQQAQSCSQRRHISTTSPRAAQFKTVEKAKAFNSMGPFSIASGVFFIVCGVGMMYYFNAEKERLARKKVRDAAKGVGKPKIGGPFDLVDQDGKRFTQEDLKGKFALVYFGFSHCPDICPDELDKMAKMIDMVKEKRGNVLKPVFITCDPARDTPAVIKQYLSEFHPEIIGLTGAWENVKAACKQYRVYFSTPPKVTPGQDYLVDHSIYFYLMDPEGDFIEVVGRQHTANQGAKIVNDHIDKTFGRTITDGSWKQQNLLDLAKLTGRRLVKIET